MQRLWFHLIPFPGKEPYNIFPVLSPSNFVDKGIILDKKEKLARYNIDIDEKYRKFRQKIRPVLPGLLHFFRFNRKTIPHFSSALYRKKWNHAKFLSQISDMKSNNTIFSASWKLIPHILINLFVGHNSFLIYYQYAKNIKLFRGQADFLRITTNFPAFQTNLKSGKG